MLRSGRVPKRRARRTPLKKLLDAFGQHAESIASILTEMKAMDAEREAVNAALRSNPVAEPVAGYNEIYRATEGTEATETYARRKCWVFRYPGSPPIRIR